MGPGNPLGGEILLGPASGSDSVCHRHPHGSPAAEKRGYDLPEEIFRPWCRQEGYRWETLLIRNRSTRPQYGLTPEERKKNIKGCFTLARQENLPDIVLLCEQRCLGLIRYLERCA